jgi:hypothetical protein
VESIWRVIIATFTYVQSHYAVHADMSGGGDTAMRDSARFHFGFTVPLIAHASAAETIAAVARSARADGGGDLGMLHAAGWTEVKPWWEKLANEEAPKVIARLPFVERPDHPAGTPVFIISNPLSEAAARDVALFALRLSGPAPDEAALHAACCACLAREGFGADLSLLLSAPGDWSAETLEAALDLPKGSATWIGSHAERFSLSNAQ